MADQRSDLTLFLSSKESWTRFAKAETGGDLAEVRAAIADAPGLAWQQVADGLGERIEEALQIPLADVLCGAWGKYRELQRLADPEACDPTETVLLPLVDHRIVSKHDPVIEIKLDEAVIGRLRFELQLSLRLKGVVLMVRGGRILAIKAGSCAGDARLQCSGATIAQRHTPEFELPFRVELGEGIPIPLH
ncbi:MAG: hypothetical protein ACFCUQ_20510 [Kiloniellales bacterium]